MSGMSGMSIGMIMFGALMILLVLRLHIGIAMFVIGAAGFVVMFDFSWPPLLNTLKNLAYARFSNYDLPETNHRWLQTAPST